MAYYYMGLGGQPINPRQLAASTLQGFQGATSRHPQHGHRMRPRALAMGSWPGYQMMPHHPGHPN